MKKEYIYLKAQRYFGKFRQEIGEEMYNYIIVSKNNEIIRFLVLLYD